ncbi:MAG: PSD1 and planctomycete cytochrome C domain-containing protein [Planctomycetota bacterium]|nr:PSD1 and planctomycete cytochrome C domain-containing protein [Planctomycetota bacterium]
MRTLLLFLLLIPATTAYADSPDFASDVMPLLRKHCARCHGSSSQEGGFRLDQRSSAFGRGDSEENLIVPGKPQSSLLLQRITDASLGDLMPLDAQALRADEVKLLSDWIAAGADWPVGLEEGKHWAYEGLQRPELPESPRVSNVELNPVDLFVLQKLQSQGLKLSPQVDRARLLRRTNLSLIGLPPSPEDLNRFLEDETPQAFEKAVDRLLDSQRFGERWAVPWLDLARYADSNGFQADQLRDNWAYRDWVIEAMNADMPFDQFTIEQLAGDLLPDATLSQKIATGFHRMATCNVEAGVDPEANRVNQIVDRVNTTATVFMGATLECAQCHDHKYDPFTQKDYYRIFAYFNNTPLEVKNTSGVTWDFYGPKMDLPFNEEQQTAREKLLAEKTDLEEQVAKWRLDTEEEFQAWLKRLGSQNEAVTWHTDLPAAFHSSDDGKFEIQEDASVLLTGKVPDKADYRFEFTGLTGEITAVRVDALLDDSIPGKGPGRGDPVRRNIILTEVEVQVEQGGETRVLELTLPHADFSQKNWEVAKAIDGKMKTGWAISPEFGKPHWSAFALAEPVSFSPEMRLSVTLKQHYGQGRVIGRPKVSWSQTDASLLQLDPELVKLAKKRKRNKKEGKKLRDAFNASNVELKRLEKQLAATEKKLDELSPNTTLVMTEQEEDRDTFVMIRGDYESPGDPVQAGVPDLFELPPDIERTGDRLELARWLTSRGNPLLARVTVNRWWGELFGIGLVNTPEDFGTQSEFPSHPALLDWLACELIESGWSRKHVLKTIVLSKTFQQNAAAPQASFESDPDNRLLARGPRFRLPAEALRDNALAISGLLSDRMSGPPVMPYQPDKIWRSVGRNQPTWKSAESEDRFRRGVYVVCKRAAPYPSFINFDAPNRGSCTVYRDRTNTPMQALTLLNDPAYAEMALAFADRILSQAESDNDTSRLGFAFQIAVSREATSFEQKILGDLLREERAKLTEAEIKQRTKLPFAAMKLMTTDQRELAAWSAVASAILNLDESMSQ